MKQSGLISSACVLTRCVKCGDEGGGFKCGEEVDPPSSYRHQLHSTHHRQLGVGVVEYCRRCRRRHIDLTRAPSLQRIVCADDIPYYTDGAVVRSNDEHNIT